MLALALAIGGLFLLVTTRMPHSPQALREALPVDGAALLAVVVIAWALLTPALVSGSLLAATTGLLLGVGPGTPVSVVGATLGGGIAFLLARRVGHRAVEELSGPRLRRLHDGLARRGFLAVFMTRLSPAPATLMHYAAGLSGIRPRDFIAGISLGGIPRLFAFTALGGSGGDLTSPPALIALGMLSALTLAGGIVAWRRRIRARRALAV